MKGKGERIVRNKEEWPFLAGFISSGSVKNVGIYDKFYL